MPQTNLQETRTQLNNLDVNYWFNHELFSFDWWFIVVFNLALFGLLILLADRRRTSTIAIAFLIAFTIIGLFDEVGKYFGWWSYNCELISFSTRFNAVNFFAIPSIITLLYQWFTRWRTFLLATVIYSLINSYIGEPIFVLLDIYKLNTWTYTGSFLVMLFIPIAVKYFTDLLTWNRAKMEGGHELNINWFRRKEKV